MLNTTQCQKPLPVGASGSYTVMAKLLVLFGAPLQLSDGETLPPLQPNTFGTCASLMAEPSDLGAGQSHILRKGKFRGSNRDGNFENQLLRISPPSEPVVGAGRASLSRLLSSSGAVRTAIRQGRSTPSKAGDSRRRGRKHFHRCGRRSPPLYESYCCISRQLANQVKPARIFPQAQ
jgi:hypothetical protein